VTPDEIHTGVAVEVVGLPWRPLRYRPTLDGAQAADAIDRACGADHTWNLTRLAPAWGYIVYVGYVRGGGLVAIGPSAPYALSLAALHLVRARARAQFPP